MSSGRSLWADEAGPAPARPPLDGDTEVDVAVVGGGYTGLWTAWYLLAREPGLRVVVIEREHVGFGASGRNGGWCVGELAAGYDSLVELGRDRRRRPPDPGPARDRRRGRSGGGPPKASTAGSPRVAPCGWPATGRSSPVSARRSSTSGHLGFGPEVVRLLDRDEALARVGATDVQGGLFFAPTAVVQPLRLVRGLADAVERRGGRIVEATAATALAPGLVATDRGDVRADVVVRATEGYTPGLAGEGRRLLPLYSLMVATEPLSSDQWEAVGLTDRETFADDRHLVIYGQRTADGRIAFGGRGAPYAYGSRIDASVESELPDPRAGGGHDPRALPGVGGRGRDPSVGRRARCPPRLGPVGRPRSPHRPGVGRWVRGRGRGRLEPGRAHPGRPHHRHRLRPSPTCPGSTTGHRGGSPSPCAGWGSTPAWPCRRWPTGPRTAPTGRPGRAGRCRGSSGSGSGRYGPVRAGPLGGRGRRFSRRRCRPWPAASPRRTRRCRGSSPPGPPPTASSRRTAPRGRR